MRGKRGLEEAPMTETSSDIWWLGEDFSDLRFRAFPFLIWAKTVPTTDLLLDWGWGIASCWLAFCRVAGGLAVLWETQSTLPAVPLYLSPTPSPCQHLLKFPNSLC